MLSDKKIPTKAGSISKNIIPPVEPDKIMFFLSNLIHDFIAKIEQDDNENMITQKITQITGASIINPWVFTAQNQTKYSKSSEDIGVSPKSDPTNVFFVIEAKKLSSSNGKDYVIGSTGGIERFKLEKHAKNHYYAGMLGYVMKDTFETWEGKINALIQKQILCPISNKLQWTESDKLTSEEKNTQSASYRSAHSCVSNKELQILHLWLKIG